MVERVLALRRRTRYEPRRLACYLAQEGYHISVFGIYRVLQRAGLVKKRRSRPRKKPQSYAMLIPGQQPPLRYRAFCCERPIRSPGCRTGWKRKGC